MLYFLCTYFSKNFARFTVTSGNFIRSHVLTFLHNLKHNSNNLFSNTNNLLTLQLDKNWHELATFNMKFTIIILFKTNLRYVICYNIGFKYAIFNKKNLCNRIYSFNTEIKYQCLSSTSSIKCIGFYIKWGIDPISLVRNVTNIFGKTMLSQYKLIENSSTELQL